MKEDFVHLHTHSDFSQLDGAAKLEDIVETVAGRGNPAVAITDHGTMRGLHSLAKSSTEHDIKPIYGVEFYVCRDMKRKGLTKEEKDRITDGIAKKDRKEAVKAYEERQGIRDRWHVTAWAETDEGLRNLYRLTSAAYADGFYWRPRIDLDALFAHSEGIMIGTGCAIGILSAHARAGRHKRARKIADELFDVFGERLFFEFMPHDQDFQREANKAVLSAAKRYGGDSGGLLITQDAHYIKPEHAKHHDVLLCIGTGKFVSDPKRFAFEGDEYFLKTRDELRADMLARHGYIPEGLVDLALDNTVLLAERCEAKVEIDPLKCLLPPVELPAGMKSSFVWLKRLCVEGWSWRRIIERARGFAKREGLTGADGLKVYSDRLREELAIIRNRAFEDYFLIVWDLISFARREGIAVGPGRGSAVGSLVSYLLGITSMDPIEHHLLFERFITADRIDMPDIDMDFEDRRRGEVIAYLFDKYGHDKVSQIATVGRFQAKQALKDVGRVLEVPFNTMNSITDLLGEMDGDILGTLATSDMMKKFNRKHPEVIEHAVALEGLAKTLGIHAAGVVTSPVPLTDVLPLEIRNKAGVEGGVKVTALDMRGVQDLGLLKLDILGLRTLSVVREASELIADRHGVELDLEEVDYHDPKVLRGFTDHDFLGIFQFDTPTADAATAGVDFVNFESIVTMNALNRPGTARTGLDRLYLDRLSNPELAKVDLYHPKVSRATKDTLGVMVYQEHIIRILKEVGGFAPSKADGIRKKIGKSVGAEELEPYREAWIEGCREATPDLPEDVAHQLWSDICQFGGYAFNKCVTGDTRLYRAGRNHHQGNILTVKELFEIQGAATPMGSKFRSGKARILQMDDDLRVRPGQVLAVFDSDFQRVFRITTESGRQVKATKAHRFFTSEGYRSVAKLCPGDKLAIMGEREGYRRKGNQTDRAKGKTYETGGPGVPEGEDNPAWIDGRDLAFREAKKEVEERSLGCCERCGVSHCKRFEYAHIRSLESFWGDYLRYNSADNIKYLCNSCHKKLDYQKGERVKAWAKGRPIEFDEIISIEYVGIEQTFDIKMGTSGHNFIANEIVSHNSHATAYSAIAYWSMYLKTHYSIEFYCALLRNEPKLPKVQEIVSHVKSQGIQVLQPDVNTSRVGFTIDGHDQIRGSLVDIKQLGAKAAETIVAAQPFEGVADFMDRVNRKAVTRRAIKALAQAGALDAILPNVKWFLGHIDELWKKANRKAFVSWLAAELDEHADDEPDFTEEERALEAAMVTPITYGMHPFEAYGDFIAANVPVELTDFSSENFVEEHDQCFIGGVIADMSTKKPPEGGTVAYLFLEGPTGARVRVRVEATDYEHFHPVIEGGIGTPVVAYVTNNPAYQLTGAALLVDLDEYRRKLDTGEELSVWEKIIRGRHPAVDREWESKAARRGAFLPVKKLRAVRAYGVVASLRVKYDKRGEEMAFFNLVCHAETIRIIAFASVWCFFSGEIETGKFVSLDLKFEGDAFFLV